MNEKRDIRKEILLLPSEFAAFTAAANAQYPPQPLTKWIVEACWEKLRSKPIFLDGVLRCPGCGKDEVWQYPTHFQCDKCGHAFTPKQPK